MDRSTHFSQTLYYARGIGMLLVLVGHYMWRPDWTWSPYLFHMPLFFIMGGMVAKPVGNIRQWLSKMGSKYLGYYVFWYCAIALATYAIVSNVDTSIVFHLGEGTNSFLAPLEYNSHNNSLFMVGWFIIAYCLSSILFQLCLTLFPSSKWQWFLGIVGLIMGWLAITYLSPLFHVERFWPYNLLTQVLVGYMFISIGYVLRSYFYLFNHAATLLLSWLLLVSLVIADVAHEIGMSWSEYPDGFLVHVLVALLGSIGVLSLSRLLCASNGSKVLIMIGKHSKDIMTLHMLAFVVVDLFCVQLGLFEIKQISALNHLTGPYIIWLYILVGTLLPIGISTVVQRCHQKLSKLSARSTSLSERIQP